eukprot:CAMPEP_0172204622 /NCGR_PEP_ID=MMETSP1050-20130122/32079_1 /TAXON_ID=233186 /ORGANISM="Cryptomonas curvata, Strain CCAP979/52" /LENGTH=109 /DNA_ID=CAMNT_0012883243 /DNA_START=582 /DNA_END=908 /DNA_ORIENTATION=+
MNLCPSVSHETAHLPNPVTRAEVKQCMHSVAAMIRDLFKKKEGLDWIPPPELDEMQSNLLKLNLLVRNMNRSLGVADEHPQCTPSRLAQPVLMVKTAAVALSQEVGALS